jgi:hypothetical protein
VQEGKMIITTIGGVLLTLVGFTIGIVVGYGLFYLEYQPFIEYMRLVRLERKAIEKLEGADK